MGGEVCFHTKLAKITRRAEDEEGLLLDLEDSRTGESRVCFTQALVLAVGHSARDTFAMLHEQYVPMEAKSFAVGVRAEHPQSMVDRDQYGLEEGSARADYLPAAAYKLTANLPDGRGVYTFCMCPGGYVVNASSEEGLLAVNGMSYHDRAGGNANSAVIVTVTPADFGGDGPLAGVDFQRRLEERGLSGRKRQDPRAALRGFLPRQDVGSAGKREALHERGLAVWRCAGDLSAADRRCHREGDPGIRDQDARV